MFTMLNFELHAKGNRLVGMAGTAVFAAAMLYIATGAPEESEKTPPTHSKPPSSEEL